MRVVAPTTAIVDRGASKIHSCRDRNAHGKTAGGIGLGRRNDRCRVTIERGADEWPGRWVLRGIEERIIVCPGAFGEILVGV